MHPLAAPSRTGVRIAGDYYQWLNAWRACLIALRDRARRLDDPVTAVGIEVNDAGSLDDVVLYRRASHSYWQVKYAVDAATLVDTAYLVAPSRSGGPSLLAKIASTWRTLRQTKEKFDLALVTNRVIDPRDPMLAGCDARTSLLMPAAARGSASSGRGKLRSQWAKEAGLSEVDLFDLLAVLRFDTGLTLERLRETLTAQMAAVGLPDSEQALAEAANGIARQVRNGNRMISLSEIDRMAAALSPASRGAGAVQHQIREINPRSLGIHAAIEVPGADGDLPLYVPRNHDRQLNAAVRSRAGFIILVGSSSVGKTRSAYEALLAELPDWWLFNPLDVSQLDAFALAPKANTVVWLDEIQRYFEGGLAAPSVRLLLNSGFPIITIATLWPEAYQAFRTPPQRGIRDDRFARQREILDMATVIIVPSQLSIGERKRANLVEAADPRLTATLNSEYGMTQALAAAPELIHRWEGAPNRYTWGLIAAAADARRVGIQAPISNALLRAAVPGYLTSTEQAKAPHDWFELALEYSTAEVHGAASVLAATSIQMGIPSGYTVADFVYQHSLRTRETSVPPASAWAAFAAHLTQPGDLIRAAAAAVSRMLYKQAEELYRAAGPVALPFLAQLQQRAGRDDDAEATWRAAIAMTGDLHSRIWLAGRLARQEKREEAEEVLRGAIAAGLDEARSRLGHQLMEWGRMEEAEQEFRVAVARAEPGGWYGLADLLYKTDRFDEAQLVLRNAISTGWDNEPLNQGGGPYHWLAHMLQEKGRYDEAVSVCREAVEACVPDSRYDLADLLGRLGNLEEAERVWRAAVAANEPTARYQLSWLLVRLDRVDEAVSIWRDAVVANLPNSRTGMATVLRHLGRIEDAERVLREALEYGEPEASGKLRSILVETGRAAEAETLCREAISAGHSGIEYGGPGLVWLLDKQGRVDEARIIARYGLDPENPYLGAS